MTGFPSVTGLGELHDMEETIKVLALLSGLQGPRGALASTFEKVILDLESDYSNERSGGIRYTGVSLQQTRPGMYENCYLLITLHSFKGAVFLKVPDLTFPCFSART